MNTNEGQRLWKNAKQIIPGGNQLLSKRVEMFLPGEWPAYYIKAKGCEIWDHDNNHYYDFAHMGVGSCVLGYAHKKVNDAVHKAVENGSMSSLNSYEEVEFAELLLELHPWAKMARFARTGGEACAIGIRIARAASGKNKVAFCGYHGWHDWYLASNLADESNLDGQLLPGLEPKGVPRGLKGSAIPFEYNNIESLRRIIEDHGEDIGTIYMEPCRGTDPKNGFLQDVRSLAKKINAVLVFDEVTSGFRVNPGGIHLTYNIEPDIAILGKALGNGYPISAVIGKREVMDVAQESFISSTFWTERIGFTAGLACVQEFKDYQVHRDLIKWGEEINKGWRKAAKSAGLSIHISGLAPLTHITFNCYDPLAAQTFYTRQMLKRGFLVGASVYTTYAYTKKLVDQFVEHTIKVFEELAPLIEEKSIESHLPYGKKHAGFKRLN